MTDADVPRGVAGSGARRPSQELLRQQALFGALSDGALAFLAERLEVRAVAAGAVLFEEGDAGRALYVLVDGEMEVVKASSGGVQTRVALLGPGDWTGEMGVVDIQPRSATVRTTAETLVVVLSSADLDALYRFDLKAYTMLVLNVARELSRRLRVADTLLAQIASSVASRR